MEALQNQISAINEGLSDIQKKICDLNNNTTSDLPKWVPLAQAVQYKGGAHLATYRSQPFLQPCCSKNSCFLGGFKVWTREDVIEWASITAKDLPSYASKYDFDLPEKAIRRSKIA